VEGDGDQQIHRVIAGEALEGRVQQIPKNTDKGEYTAVFKSMDRLLDRPLIEGAGAMDLEIAPLLEAGGAEVTFFITGRVGKATTRAVRRAYGPDCLAAIRTDDGGFPLAAEEGLTDGADRREDEVQ